MSALTTSAPSLAKPFALALFTSLVSTRAAKVRFGSLRIARTKPPPSAPVAPTTAITRRVCLKCFDYSVSNSYQIAQTVRLRLLLEATLRNRNLAHLWLLFAFGPSYARVNSRERWLSQGAPGSTPAFRGGF